MVAACRFSDTRLTYPRDMSTIHAVVDHMLRRNKTRQLSRRRRNDASQMCEPRQKKFVALFLEGDMLREAHEEPLITPCLQHIAQNGFRSLHW